MGSNSFAGKPTSRPPTGRTGRELARTNVAAFQQLWFNIASAQLGYTGASSGTRSGAFYGTTLNNQSTGCSARPPKAGRSSRATTRCSCSSRRPSAAGRSCRWRRGRTTTGSSARPTMPEKELVAYAESRGAADRDGSRHARARPEHGLGRAAASTASAACRRTPPSTWRSGTRPATARARSAGTVRIRCRGRRPLRGAVARGVLADHGARFLSRERSPGRGGRSGDGSDVAAASELANRVAAANRAGLDDLRVQAP